MEQFAYSLELMAFVGSRNKLKQIRGIDARCDGKAKCLTTAIKLAVARLWLNVHEPAPWATLILYPTSRQVAAKWMKVRYRRASFSNRVKNPATVFHVTEHDLDGESDSTGRPENAGLAWLSQRTPFLIIQTIKNYYVRCQQCPVQQKTSMFHVKHRGWPTSDKG